MVGCVCEGVVGWGQPDVQSYLLSPCLCFGSWTDSQPCGMAAVEGAFFNCTHVDGGLSGGQ